MIIINEDDIIQTYKGRIKLRAVQYKKAVKSRTLNKTFSFISKKLSVPYRTVQSWFREGRKPRPIKVVENLKTKELLPLFLDDKDERVLLFVRCFAFIFGDGHISTRRTETVFSGQKFDLNLLKTEIESKFNLKCRIRHKKSSVYHLVVGKELTHLLIAVGAPVGDKVIKQFSLPAWLMESSVTIKKQFLGTIFGNEGCPLTFDKHTDSAFYAPIFLMAKHIKLEREHLIFLNQIKEILKECGIKSSKTMKRGMKQRRDGKRIGYYYFKLKRDLKNLIKFYRIIGFKYAHTKMIKYENRLKEIFPNLLESIEDFKLYQRVMELRKKGLGDVNCTKILNSDEKSKIHGWIYHNKKPKHINAKGEIEKLLFHHSGHT